MSESTKCRVCKTAKGTIYINARGQKTKTPICLNCYEAAVANLSSADGHKTGYRGPGRDPFREKLPQEHFDALSWWEMETEDWGDE